MREKQKKKILAIIIKLIIENINTKLVIELKIL